MATFLFEVGLEEIPARMIAAAEEELGRRVVELLSRENLFDGQHTLQTFSSPRRLAVLISGILLKQADSEEQLTGPPAKVAFKDGVPTPAAIAFAKKVGVEVETLSTVTTAKGEYVSALVKKTGKTAADILAENLPRDLAQIYWAKNMYWRAGKPERFVRPLQWLVALLENQVVPVEFAGISAGRETRGHRVLHGPAPVVIAAPQQYQQALENAYVMADVPSRRHKTRKALDAVVRTVPGARWREDEALVDTVTHLTEWPSVMLGTFEPQHLSLPEEVLVTVMRDHQKYFAVEDAAGKIAPHFLAVLNTAVDEQGLEIIRHGNARVLRARFNDARFFWDLDQRTPLADRVQLLTNVTFHKDLGNYFEKSKQTESLALGIARAVPGVGLDELSQAALLAKTDLTTELVKEFTELQGIVGGLYARAQGLGEKVAAAIYAQYQPASMDDAIPSTVEGQILGLADRMQTIHAMFAIGLEPTGSKDPFALRRAANGIIKILAESGLSLKLSFLESEAARGANRLPQVSVFLRERVEFYLRDVRGFRYDVVNAVLATDADDIRDAIARAEALTAMRESEDFLAVSAGFKRIKNILRQAQEKNIAWDGPVVEELLIEAEERALFTAMQQLAPEVEAFELKQEYREALESTAKLRPGIDAFFNKVMVMAPEEALRRNRLALIAQGIESFSHIGDVSEVVIV